MSKLKPCPFCGGEAHKDKDSQGAFIGCNDCNIIFIHNFDDRKLVKAWNRRTGDERIKEKSWIMWADDDWANYSARRHRQSIITNDLGVFHTKLENCYEGKPRKVRITIEEID